MAAPPEPPSDLAARAWVLVDPASGDVLAARDPAVALPVASATKLMTAYLAMRTLRPGAAVTAPPYEAAAGESLMGLRAGDTATVRDLLFGLLVASGNDAAEALAFRVSGSVPGFVDRMNAAARRLGLEDTAFVDPIGLGDGNVSSARDLVALAIALRREPLFRRIVDTPRITVRADGRPLRLVNRNALVRREPFVDGVKTGTTLAAGFVLVASAERRGARFVSALLGAPSELARDDATLSLLRYGASLYARRTLVRSGERVASVTLTDDRGRLSLVAAVAVESVARADQRPRVLFEPPDQIDGPVAEGQPFGTAMVTLGGREVGEVEVIAARAVAAPREDGGLPGWVVAMLAGAGLIALALGTASVVNASRKPR